MPGSYSCYVTIKNRSSSFLRNPQYSADFGRWTKQPPNNVEKLQRVSAVLEDISGLPAGTEGKIEYQTDHGTVGVAFQCGYVEDNYVRVLCSDGSKRLSFYANNQPDFDWSDSGSWGKEGQYPAEGHPLSVLLLVDEFEDGWTKCDVS
jgi:hypothetical protein